MVGTFAFVFDRVFKFGEMEGSFSFGAAFAFGVAFVFAAVFVFAAAFGVAVGFGVAQALGMRDPLFVPRVQSSALDLRDVHAKLSMDA